MATFFISGDRLLPSKIDPSVLVVIGKTATDLNRDIFGWGLDKMVLVLKSN